MHLQEEAASAASAWRQAPKELQGDDNDEFDDYFKGMFP